MRAAEPPHGAWPDARARRDRRMASAGQRRRAHADVARCARAQPERRDRVPDAGRVPVPAAADLQRPAHRAAQSARDRPPHRARPARRDPHRDRRADRARGARLLPARASWPFTTCFTTLFPEYIAARVPIPRSWSYAVLRRFHAARHRHHGGDAVAEDGCWSSAASAISACGRAASIPTCSVRSGRSSSICRARSS